MREVRPQARRALIRASKEGRARQRHHHHKQEKEGSWANLSSTSNQVQMPFISDLGCCLLKLRFRSCVNNKVKSKVLRE